MSFVRKTYVSEAFINSAIKFEKVVISKHRKINLENSKVDNVRSNITIIFYLAKATNSRRLNSSIF